MKTILVFDTVPNRNEAHCKVCVDLGNMVWRYANGSIEAYPPNTDPVLTGYDLVILHSNDKPDFDTRRITGPILSFGGGSAIVQSGRVPRSVSAPDSTLTLDELKLFCEHFFGSPAKTIDEVIAIVWADKEASLAFRLLREAYILAPSGSGDKTWPVGVSNGKEIKLSCPPPCDWFSLIGVPVPRPESDETAWHAFAKLMGDDAEVATELAQAIAKGDTNAIEVAAKKIAPKTGGSQ